jgi:fatty-acyl-CoA synthase
VAFVEYDPETGEPVRDKKGRLCKVGGGKPGLLLSKVSSIQPFEGYTDAEATEKKLVRNGFRDGDVWLNTGDLMRPQGWHHAAFVDRLGDRFRWKGENVATTDVEAAVSEDPAVEAVTVFGVQVPGADGRAGMAAVVCDEGTEFDGKSLANTLYEHLPSYAVPLFVRVVDSLEQTSTFWQARSCKPWCRSPAVPFGRKRKLVSHQCPRLPAWHHFKPANLHRRLVVNVAVQMLAWSQEHNTRRE